MRPDDTDAPADGPPAIDETLIDEMLSMSVQERLRQNDRMVRTLLALRAALARPIHDAND